MPKKGSSVEPHAVSRRAAPALPQPPPRRMAQPANTERAPMSVQQRARDRARRERLTAVPSGHTCRRSMHLGAEPPAAHAARGHASTALLATRRSHAIVESPSGEFLRSAHLHASAAAAHIARSAAGGGRRDRTREADEEVTSARVRRSRVAEPQGPRRDPRPADGHEDWLDDPRDREVISSPPISFPPQHNPFY